MWVLLLVLALIVLGWAIGLLVPRITDRSRHVEPLSEVADRLVDQLRSLPETHEHEHRHGG
jgi:hypothetical protein